MNTTNIKKEINKLEKAIRKASRVLLELEVAQAKLEKALGLGRTYKSADALMRDIKQISNK
jgi:hypothetical protein